MEHPVVVGGRPLTATEGRISVLYVDMAPTVPEPLRAADEIGEIHSAERADDALAILEAERVDCVVSEYTLPDSDGLALLRAVRTRWSHLPFVLFTNDGDEAVASEAVGPG